MDTQKYLEFNAKVNLLTTDGKLQLEEDKKALQHFFQDRVNPNTVFFHTLAEKTEYMIENGYWDKETVDSYKFSEFKEVFEHAYSYKFRFKSFVGALKFYTSFACKTSDGERFLERYEDRVAMVALYLARGEVGEALNYVDLIITGKFQPATPTFLNAGRANSGELVSCFLLRIEDNMESIGRSITNSLQLSKRGGGVALLLTNLREEGARIKNTDGIASGVVPVMKQLEDAFSYANQLGARQGAGAVYLNACHPDIMTFLDTKRENADEKIRIKTLSLGVVVPDIVFEKAAKNEDLYLFSPYDVEREYGVAMSDLSVTEHYNEFVENSRITKSKVNARKLLQTIAEVQFESGYPYIMFEDTVNAQHLNAGRVNMSNLCSEILQGNEPSTFDEANEYNHVGTDISCNLGSLNIANVMSDVENLGFYVSWATQALTVVAEETNLRIVPSIRKGNDVHRSIGLGQMNLAGFLAENHIYYGSEEALDFVNVYFALVKYFALNRSHTNAFKHGSYKGFENSKFATGEALQEYIDNPPLPQTDKVKELFKDFDFAKVNWKGLSDGIQRTGLYNKYLTAVPPTGNISYINHATASIHPVTSAVEIRKEGKMGRVYYPQPGLTEDNLKYYQDAYEVGYEKIIDTYAVATKHTDQGLSLTLFFPDTATTRDINKAQIYAWRKGIKTLYYARIRQDALLGTEVEGCVSCTL